MHRTMKAIQDNAARAESPMAPGPRVSPGVVSRARNAMRSSYDSFTGLLGARSHDGPSGLPQTPEEPMEPSAGK